jgi:hypothetical protein
MAIPLPTPILGHMSQYINRTLIKRNELPPFRIENGKVMRGNTSIHLFNILDTITSKNNLEAENQQLISNPLRNIFSKLSLDKRYSDMIKAHNIESELITEELKINYPSDKIGMPLDPFLNPIIVEHNRDTLSTNLQFLGSDGSIKTILWSGMARPLDPTLVIDN